MPGKQAKVVTPPMLKRMRRRVSRSSSPPATERSFYCPSKPACGLARSLGSIGRWYSTLVVASPTRSRCATQLPRKGLGVAFPCIPTLASLTGSPAPQRSRRSGHTIRERWPFSSQQHRQLVRCPVRRTRVRRVLIALRATHFHNFRCAQHSPLWLLVA
jgi:hypothetical protein